MATTGPSDKDLRDSKELNKVYELLLCLTTPAIPYGNEIIEFIKKKQQEVRLLEEKLEALQKENAKLAAKNDELQTKAAAVDAISTVATSVEELKEAVEAATGSSTETAKRLGDIGTNIIDTSGCINCKQA